jgi:hypothetical protein
MTIFDRMFSKYWAYMEAAMKYQTAVLDSLADVIVSNHSFSFRTFQESVMTVNMIEAPGLKLTYDRLSLRVYSHNLDEADYSYLVYQIRKRYWGNKTRDEDKIRSEYDVLFDFMSQSPRWNAFEIRKETRPDFVLTGKQCIGIEVTECTTESDSVLKAISNQNSGKGKTPEEMHRDALIRHGAKADNYSYREIAGKAVIGSGLFDVRKKKYAYANEIIKKYRKYSNHFWEYDEFIVICDARYTICITEQEDAEEVIELAKEGCSEMRGFAVCIIFQDSLCNLQTAWFSF